MLPLTRPFYRTRARSLFAFAKAAHLGGVAPECLLDSYDDERRSAIKDTAAASLHNYRVQLPFIVLSSCERFSLSPARG